MSAQPVSADTAMAPFRAILTSQGSTLAERIQAGAELWRLKDLAEKALEPLKEELRSLALAQLAGKKESVTFDGVGLSQARVTVPEDIVKLDPRAQASLNSFQGLSLEMSILEGQFNSIYKVELRSNSVDVFNELPEDARRHMARKVKIDVNTPRVSLQTFNGVEPL